MRILFPFVATMLVAGSAQANLCSSDWLKTASASAVRALVRAGADVNEVCMPVHRNRPLHQALNTAEITPEVVGALIEAGADVTARNNYGRTPFELVEERFERETRGLPPGSAAYRREAAIRDRFHAANNAAGNRVNAARDQLCDRNWWRTSANLSTVRALLRQPGVNREMRCNGNNDRPVHIALSEGNFVSVPQGTRDAILALAASGVSLGSPNNQGRTALDLAELHYDRYLGRAMRRPPAWCRGGAPDADIELYLGVKFLATGESRERLLDATRRDVCGDARGNVPRQVGARFRECDACPEMVVMPGGRLALGRYEVTVDEYRAFASAAGGAGGGCYAYVRDSDGVGWDVEVVASLSWRSPGFSQSGRHPVVCVSWHDAQEYVSWLSRTTGATYRLPSEAEWGRAAGGSSGGCSANGGDAGIIQWLEGTFGGKVSDQWVPSCAGSDGSLHTAAVGSYGSNGVGLSDMVGNVWEWTEDCWEGDCGRR